MGERELPEGWEIKRLGDGLINEIYRYPSFYNIDYIQEGIGVLKVENISKMGFVSKSLDSIQYIAKTTNEKFPKTILKENDLIMAVRGATIGKIALIEKKFAGFNINPNLIKITVNCKKIVPKFFWLFLNSKNGKLQFKSKTSSTSKETITVPQFLSIELPLPPLPVQRHIVAVLEQAEAVKRQRQGADALTGALLQSVFYEMFGDPMRNERGWDLTAVQNVVQNDRDITYGIVQPGDDTEGGIPTVRPMDLLKNYIYPHGLKRVDPQIERSYPRSRLTGGELLLSIRGTLGLVAIASNEMKNANISRGIAVIAPNSMCKVEFLLFLFKHDKIQQKIVNESKGIALQGFNLVDLRKMQIPLPPLALQQQFARIVQDVERIREHQVASGRQIEGLCEGLMQRAFAGELVA